MTQSSLPPTNQDEPPRLKFLRWLVIGLTVTMIVGLITIVSLIVMTFMRTNDRVVDQNYTIPVEIKVPPKERLLAYTKGPDWAAIVTTGDDTIDRIHILDTQTGEIRQTVEIDKTQ